VDDGTQDALRAGLGETNLVRPMVTALQMQGANSTLVIGKIECRIQVDDSL
jgi:hypothetical protein